MTISPREKSEYHSLYGHRKCGTPARVFSQAIAYGNGKNEKKGKDTVEGTKKGVNMWKHSRHEKKTSPDGLAIARAYRPTEVATPRSSA